MKIFKMIYKKVIILFVSVLILTLFSYCVEAHELKLKLTPKVAEIKTYWRAEKFLNWDDDLPNWCFRTTRLSEFVELYPYFFSNDQIINQLKTTEFSEEGEFLIPAKDSLEIYLPDGKAGVLSRNVEINIEEFPFFSFGEEFIGGYVSCFLGIDYLGDKKIDRYIRIDDFGEVDILQMAIEEGRDLRKIESYILREVIFLIQNIPENDELRQKSNPSLEKISFYSKRSLILEKNTFHKKDLFFEDEEINSQVTEKKDDITIKPGGFLGTKVYISLVDKDVKNFPLFSFEYTLTNPEVQKIDLAIVVKGDFSDKTIILSPEKYTRDPGYIELDIPKLISNINDLKFLIVSFRYPVDYGFNLGISKLKLFTKFAYPLLSKDQKERFLSLVKNINFPLIEIDGSMFYLDDFNEPKKHELFEVNKLSKKIELSKGEHTFKKFENQTFDVDSVAFKCFSKNKENIISNGAKISLKRINPTKYLVKIRGATEPFWLVFGERFHQQWRLYSYQNNASNLSETAMISQRYSNSLHSEEIKQFLKFVFQDIAYLFRKQISAPHYKVNGYANGWYLEPISLGEKKDFNLVIYFSPQSYFYIGFIISIVALVVSLVYLLMRFVYKKVKRC